MARTDRSPPSDSLQQRADGSDLGGLDAVPTESGGDDPVIAGAIRLDPVHPDGVRDDAGILIVDDRSENLLALSAILEPLGQPIVTARSGPEALRQLLNGEFSLMLVDVRMPGMSGYELATFVRQRERTRHLPIIFLTAAETDAEHVFRGYRTGAVDYLVKPFDPSILRSKVTVFVDLHHKQRQIEHQAELLRQRELQQLAQQSEARYRFLAEAIPHHVWEASADGSLVFTSERLRRELADGSDDAVLGWPVHPDDEPTFERRWNRARAAGLPLEQEVRLRLRDGTYQWFTIRALPFVELDGTLSRWVGTNTNIDERKRDEIRRAELLVAEQTARANAERREREARFLAEVTSTLEEPGDFGVRLARLVTVCVPEIADFATVEVSRSDGHAEIVAAHHRDPDLEAELLAVCEDVAFFAPLSSSGLSDAANASSTARPHAVEPTDELLAHPGWGKLAPLSLMTIPIVTRDGAAGTLLIGTSTSGRTYDQRDIDTAEELARRAMLVLDNARLYDNQGRIFRNLQLSLLAGITESTDGVTIAVRYQAATHGMEIGGDYYDVFELPGGRLGIVVGDVVGQGLAAAAAMAKVRSALRALALTHHDPADVFARLDHYVEETDEAAFTTVVYGVLDPHTGELCYSSAGHPPPLLLHADGRTEWLEEGRSPPLGVDRRRRAQAMTVLPKGSTLILYTDGLVERRNEVLDVGFERLAEAARTSRSAGVEEFADHLVDTVLEGASHDDDIALLCVRLETTDAAVFARRFPAQAGGLRRIRRSFAGWLREQQVDGREAGDILLACGEAFSNCIEHAYDGIGKGDISLEARLGEDELRLAIRDFGHWRPQTVALDRGRGIPIMRAVFDEVRIDQRNDGTTVLLSKLVTVPNVKTDEAPPVTSGAS